MLDEYNCYNVIFRYLIFNFSVLVESIIMEVLSVVNLKKHFKDVVAVKGVSFSVRKGTCFGLLGPNGAGKTTTIEMMEGILKPNSGRVNYFGSPASKLVYKEIGIQFQNTALPDYLSVRETLELFASFYDQSIELNQLISLCSLDDFSDRDAKKLSGGQRQRLLLALALVNDPQIIFLDEPTTGLDPQARRNFWDLIQKIKKQGKTIILTTHYMDEAQILCDDIVVMDSGEVVAHGKPEQLLSDHFDGVLVRLPIVELPEKFPLSDNMSVINGYLEIKTNEVNQTLNLLMEYQFELSGLQVKTPNLEDLFIKLTGHELRS